MADRITDWIEEGSLYIAVIAAWTAMLGSLYFSEVAGYVPCAFCWYQRILMYPLAVIIPIGLLLRDRFLPFYVLPLSVTGIGFATYHYLLQKTDLFINVNTCQVGVPCSGIWVNWFGFITIPFLALTAFLVITFMSVIALQAGVPYLPETEDGEEEEAIRRPWLPVFGIIAVISLIFFTLGQLHGSSDDTHTTAIDQFAVVEGGAQTTVDGTPVEGTAGSTHEGATLYAQACAVCHGPDGNGVDSLGTSLVASSRVTESTAEELLAYIRKGSALNDPDNQSGIAMPASGGRPDLSDAEMLAIIEHVKALQ